MCKRYVLLKDVTIKAGSIFEEFGGEISYESCHYGHVFQFASRNPDHYGELIVGGDVVADFPGYFAELGG